ncbi:nuclear transport factor 2 family protein [Streptomyces sp. NPDC006645]|uniref:YybH family protein n=1 Tax=unclassified Streptomyces TaxID=2593676 RepID=UPI0033A86C71
MTQLTNDAEKHTALYVEAFNSGDLDAINAMYTEDAVAVWDAGVPVTGQARIDSMKKYLAAKPTMTAVPRQSFVTGDTALLIVDWSIDTTDDDGNPETLSGVGVDVLRLGDDGKWRYAIDDPYGE